MNEANNAGEYCSVCGFHFQEATQEFAAISVEPDQDTSVNENANTATLRVCYGKQEGLVFKLGTGTIELGRSPKCDVILNDMTVSRNHAEIEKIDGEWLITDLDSFNGVWVNNKPVKNAVLHDGDLLQIGCFVIRFSE
jgi:pSer/pThr/pTyr-binding forkhead associated (FHA) protein